MKIYPVKITIENTHKVYTEEFQTSEKYYKAWQAVLRRAYHTGEVECLCPGKNNKPLVIRYFSELDKYCLSRYPETGHNHAEDCRFYGEDKDLAFVFRRPAIEKFSDGTILVRLPFGLKERNTSPKKNAPEEDVKKKRSSHGSSQKPTITLLDLLRLLWEEAKLKKQENTQQGYNIKYIAKRLRQAAEKVMTRSAKISDVLLIAGDSEETNRKVIETAIDKKMRPIIIAPLARWTQERENLAKGHLALSYFQGIPYVKLSPESWKSFKKKFPEAIEAWQSGQRITAIIQADTPKNTNAVTALEIALTNEIRLK